MTIHAPTQTSAPLDEDLRDWHDAAVTGGLPSPARSDRWQPLRAGLVSLWEFEVAEYWFARGWAQLTGRNETGKSSLMALTTLIPWLGDTSTGNIDTLGEHGKRFRYYVEPTTSDGDRRDAEAATNRGWLWVEYGRIVDGRPQYVTTAAFAEARRASSHLTLRWCTATGSRVRAGLHLVVDGFVAAPKELLDNPGFQVHPRATDYRHWCAEHLLGSDTDRLEAVGKLLRVTRTPKLGERLNIGFVSEKMRDALPELERTEIDALATGWDQLEAVRADADAAREAASAVRTFLRRGWTPWAHARLRSSADVAAAARSAFDAVTRREREATNTLVQVQEQAERNAARASSARQGRDAETTALEELQASARYTDAAGRLQRLEDARRTADVAKQAVTEADRRHAGAARRAAVDDEAAAQAQAEVEPAENDRRAAADLVVRRLDDAGLSDQAQAVRDEDLARVDQGIRDRRAAMDDADRHHRAFATADRDAERAESEAAQAMQRADEARSAAQTALAAAQAMHTDLARSVAAWAATLEPTPDDALVDAWIADLPDRPRPSLADDSATSPASDGQPAAPGRQSLAAAIAHDWYEPRSARIAQRLAAARHRRQVATQAVRAVQGEIAELQAAPDLVYPSPPGWVRRERPEPGPAGAPLWWLVNPIADPAAAHPDGGTHAASAGPGRPWSLPHIEAALAAMGLLDAWITPDGAYRRDRDGADVVIDLLGTPTDPTDTTRADDAASALSEVLEVSAASGKVGQQARQVLAQVTLVAASTLTEADDLPATADRGYVIASDGRWRTPLLSGRAEPERQEAEWLGDEARRAARARRLEQLQTRLADAEAELTDATTAVDQADADRVRVDAAHSRRPDEAPLLRALDRAADRQDEADRAQERAERADRQARTAREHADSARARLLEHAAEHRLPTTTDDLAALREALSELRADVQRLRYAISAVQAVRRTAEQARQRAQDSAEHARELLDELQRHRDAADSTRTTLRALEATVDADTRAVLEEVQRRRAEVARLRDRVDELQRQTVTIAETLGRAQSLLAGVAEERQRRTAERDAAFAGFRRLIDAGLAASARIELPNADSASVEAVRGQVAALREAVVITGWPDEQAAQQDHIEKTWSALVTEGEKTRTVLETRGRTLRRVEDEDLPRVEVVVDSSGVLYAPHEAATRLERIRDDLGAAYDQRVHETLGELLGSTFIEHLRGHLVAMRRLVGDINTVLRQHPTGTTRTALRICLDAREGATAGVLTALEEGTALLDESVSGAVREFLRGRVEGAREDAAARGEADWGDRLAVSLDYRQWFDVSLEKRSGDAGRWTALTPASYAGLSGGARAVMLMLPLVATLAALYGGMRGAPRPLWLDEAFDGLDSDNRAMVLDLLREFDLDVLIAGPGRLVNVPTVPAAAIYQVVRAPDPFPGADLTLELWACDTLTVVDLPPATSRAAASATDQEPDLWSAAQDPPLDGRFDERSAEIAPDRS